jgi:hypothetical protein
MIEFRILMWEMPTTIKIVTTTEETISVGYTPIKVASMMIDTFIMEDITTEDTVNTTAVKVESALITLGINNHSNHTVQAEERSIMIDVLTNAIEFG